MTSKTSLITYNENGLITAEFEVIKEYVKNQMQTIFGNDINIGDGTADGSLINLMAEMMYDTSNAIVSVYNSMSREGAVGVQLDNFASLNNVTRKQATKSKAMVALRGVEGTIIVNGLVKDVNGVVWELEPSITLKNDTLYQVTSTVAGDVFAGPNEINSIVTQVAGWTEVTNPDPSNRGKDIEKDAQLRYRIKSSFDITSLTVRNGLQSALEQVANVNGAIVYENDTDSQKPIKPGSRTNLEAHSIACVVNGGDNNDIAKTILSKKTPGIPTRGTTNVSIPTDTFPIDIKFYKSRPKDIYVKVSIIPNEIFVESDKEVIKETVSKMLVNLPIASKVLATEIITELSNSQQFKNYTIQTVKLGDSSSQTLDNINLEFDETSNSEPSFINVEVVE